MNKELFKDHKSHIKCPPAHQTGIQENCCCVGHPCTQTLWLASLDTTGDIAKRVQRFARVTKPKKKKGTS